MDYALWDRGYAERRACIMACNAPISRRLCACQKVWRRMTAMEAAQ